MKLQNDLTKKLKQIEALKNCDINLIMNESYKILGHPIMLFDTSYNLLSYTKNIVTDDRFWNELATTGVFSHESVNFFRDEGFIKSFAESEIVSYMKSDKLKYDRMNGKLFDKDNVQLGNISVVACIKPFEQGDNELVAYLCEILSIKLQNSDLYKRIEKVYQELLINKLIEGKHDKQKDKAAIAEFYKGLKPNLYLAVVDTSQYEKTLTHLAYFRDLFRRIQKNYKYFTHLDYIIIIISTANSTLRTKKDLVKLNNFFAKNKIYAGISGRFLDFNCMKKYYSEALNALNYGLKSKRNQNIFMFDNYRIEHFLNNTTAKNYDHEIKNQIITSIQDYDEKTGTSFLNTLYYYLMYGRSAVLAANAIGINEKSLSNELIKMQELFGIDWTNGDMLANMHFSLKMLNNADN